MFLQQQLPDTPASVNPDGPSATLDRGNEKPTWSRRLPGESDEVGTNLLEAQT
jgi:hypothetical protein